MPIPELAREPIRTVVGAISLGAGLFCIVGGIQQASLPLGLLSLVWFAGAFWLLDVRLSWQPIARINWASVSPGLLLALLGLCGALVGAGLWRGLPLLLIGLAIAIILGRATILNGVSVRGRLGDFARTLFAVLIVTSFAAVTAGAVLSSAEWPNPGELKAGASPFPRFSEGAICLAPSAILLAVWALVSWFALIRQLLRASRSKQ